jgi:hypothetical protein
MGQFADLFDEDAAAPMAVRMGAGTPPDKAAEAAALSRRYGLPAAVAEQFAEDYRARAKTEDAREVFKAAPRLGSWIAEQPERAKVVHDDLDTLGKIERAIGGMASYVMGARPAGGMPTDIANATRLLFQGGASQAAAGYHGTAAAIRETLGMDATQAREEQRSSQAFVAKLREQLTPQDGILSRGVASGLTSAGQQLFSLPLGFLPGGGQAAMLGTMGVQSFGASYGKGRDEGLSVPRALAFGAQDATAEVVTERFLGAAGLVADAKAGTTAARLFVRDIMREIPGESAATLWQNFNAWANINPDKPVADFLMEQPAALAETIIATTVGAGAQVGAIRGVQKVMGDVAMRQAEAQRAERNGAQLEQLAALGKASKTMTRDATTAREFIAQVADEAGEQPTELYVSPEALTNSLNQSGISPEEFEAIAPVAALALRSAETGADVRIPVSEFVAAEAVMAPLIDDLRVGPNEPTRAEAREYVKTHGEALQRDVEAELQKRDDHAEFKAAVGAVRQQFEAELGATKRFRPEVNKAYADLLANFYGATAARLGMTPQELVQRYQLRVRADLAGGARTLEQSSALQIRAMEDEAKALTAAIRKRSAAERAAGVEQISDATLALNVADRDRALELMAKVEELRRPPIIVKGPRAAPAWVSDMPAPQRATLDAFPEWDGSDGFQQRAPGSGVEDDLHTSAQSHFNDYEVAPGVRSVPLDSLGDLGGYSDAKEQKRIEALAERMREDKEITPIFVGIDPNGEAYIMEGQHRARAFKAMGMQSIPARVVVDFDPVALNQSPRQTDTPAFKRWFGDSKVVDAQGKPLVVYHGSPVADFAEFDLAKVNQSDPDGPYNGFWFSSSRSDAETSGRFPWGRPNTPDAQTRPFYLSIKNPASRQEARAVAREIRDTWESLHPAARSLQDAVRLELEARGFDGVVHSPYLTVDREAFERDGEVKAGKGYTLKKDGGGVDLYQEGTGFLTGYENIDEAIEAIRHSTLVAFRPEQIKSAIGNRGTFDPSDPSILNQSKATFDQSQTEAFKRWSNNAPLITTESADTHLFKTGERVVVEGFHGTKRPDRVGTKFLRKRATSGPMAFFTSSPELASTYAQGKQDTSLANEDQAYENWFKVKFPGDRSSVDIVRAWYRLTREQQDRVAALAPRVMFGEEVEADGGNVIVLGPEGHDSGTGSYDYNLDATKKSWDRRGNPLKALVEDWLNSGNLFNDEERFMQVLKLAGVPVDLVTHDSPHAEYPFVYKVYIAMQKPLVVGDIPQEVRDALGAAAKRDRSRAAAAGADMWDKNTRTLRDWVKALGEENSEYVWTSIPDKVTEVFKSLGYDGIVDKSGKGGGAIHPVYIPFEETQVKSAIGNKGKFDPLNKDILKQGEGSPRAQIAMADDITASPSVVSLLQGADLSSFLHESGHFFLEVQTDLAAKIQAQIDAGASVSDGERAIVDDMNRLLKWFGIAGSPELSALNTWAAMTLDERRASHEQFAQGFEKYAMEGNAPSLDLQGVFQRFRSWLIQVYHSLRNLNVTLDDDVRAVMSRMIATDFAIEEAEAQRAMGPLFKDAESAGMTLEEFNAYQATARAATEQAIGELQTRSLKDMRWLSGARDKALKARQKEVDALRRETRMAVRAEVYQEPVYKAWQWLTARIEADDKIRAERASAGLDVATDSLLVAIAKLGGIARESATRDLGVHKDDYRQSSGLFGKPVFRAEGGKTADMMAEALALQGYLTTDEHGKHDLVELEDKIAAELRGEAQYAYGKDYRAAQPGATLNVDGMNAGRLDLGALAEQYGPASPAIATLKARRMTAERGIDQAIVAAKFGFDSGDALVQALLAAPPPNETIEADTDQRMLEEHGDITSPQAMERAADEAVHNEARARFIASELKALQDANKVRTGKRGTVDVMARAAREYAGQIIARLKVRELRPHQYAAAEARNARLAEKALAAAKLDEAALHKRNQLVNNYAARAAYAAQDEVRRAQEYFRRFDKRSKGIDPDYQDQIEALLERFDFRATLRETDRRKSLRDWYDQQAAMGTAPDIPADILDEANRKSYRDMTMEEIRGLRDTVEQIEHLGRLKNRLLTARHKRDFDAVADEIAATVREHGGKERPVSLEPEKGAMPWLRGFMAAHRKLSSLMRQMDGADDGPLYEAIVRGMNERGAWEDTRQEQATMALAALYAPLEQMKGGVTGDRSRLFIPEINASLTRGGRLAVALNWGNEDNRQRLMVGDGKRAWSEGQVQAILRTLSAEELAFVNGVWEFIDGYWPEIAAKQKRVTGVEPEKVQAVPFNVRSADGQDVAMRGGYYPIKYDVAKSDRAETHEAAQIAEDMLRGARTQATTRRGHTKERVANVERPLRLDLNVVTQHVGQVLHDLAWHEWLIDTSRLLRDERVSSAMREHYGPEAVKTIRADVEAIATGDLAAQTAIDRALQVARNNVTRAVMGASLTTAFLQPFGLTQSAVRIGGKHVVRGLARWAGDAARLQSSLTWIADKSEFMRLRQKTFNRELREISGLVGGKSKAMRMVDGGLFFLMRKMQLVADVPTWIGQYEKSIAQAEPGADAVEVEAKAVADADRAVLESQGGGHIKDLAEVQRRHPMLTQFYSYFSVTLNLAAESTVATDFKNPRAVAGWLGDMSLLLVIPAIAPAYLLSAMRGGDDDEDMVTKLAKWQGSYLLGLFVAARELSGVVQGYEYAGPPVGRVVSDTQKFGEQVAQGEVDEPAVLALARLLGTALGIPVTQALRSYKGWKAWDEGEDGAGPQSVLLGPPEQ